MFLVLTALFETGDCELGLVSLYTDFMVLEYKGRYGLLLKKKADK
jgi:hypothetical protein